MNPRELRKKLGLTQAEFWPPIGVTQSGGSRYEAGREIPEPVAILIQLYWDKSLYAYKPDKFITQMREYIDVKLKQLRRKS